VASPTPVNTSVDQTTRAGVGYSILVPAPAGAAVCKFGDTVAMEYTGWLVDGTKFDSSVGKPPYVFKIGAGRVIQGWDLGIPGMGVGEVRKLVLPPDLAYGSSGQGSIPPDATLVFQVKLIAIQ
jgi:FKBP-type peptidyl-prolyl cis-trans isomerase